MSSREPLWFCHECHAEMRPLMVPEPTCASCHGTFVEKMENPADDPRQFQPQYIGFNAQGVPYTMDDPRPQYTGFTAEGVPYALLALQGLMNSPRQITVSTDISGPGTSFRIHTSNGGTRSITFGRPNRPRSGSGNPNNDIPTISEFLRRTPDTTNRPQITGPMMAQYLMALLGHRSPLMDTFRQGISDNHLERGRWGDYVFDQEALDQIITQIMEDSNASMPVPASEEKLQELPREVLEVGSPTLEKECAVCKDQFKLETEDPDEQIVVTLPCHHPFHEPCILPWLKSSGTCPVCRYALVPQPEQHEPSPGPSSGGPSSRRSPPSNNNRHPDGGGIFHTLFNIVGSSGTNSGNEGGNTGPSPRNRGSSDGTSRRRNSATDACNQLPGGWQENLD